MATKSMSALSRFAARTTLRPIRPKPLMATRTDMGASFRNGRRSDRFGFGDQRGQWHSVRERPTAPRGLRSGNGADGTNGVRRPLHRSNPSIVGRIIRAAARRVKRPRFCLFSSGPLELN